MQHVHGFLMFHYPDDRRITIKAHGDTVRMVWPAGTYPALEAVIQLDHVPQLITDLKNAIGDTDDPNVPVHHMGPYPGVWGRGPASDAGEPDKPGGSGS